MGSTVVLSLSNGAEAYGKLIEIAIDHVTVAGPAGPVTILPGAIAAWRVVEPRASGEATASALPGINRYFTPTRSNRPDIIAMLSDIYTEFERSLKKASLIPKQPDFEYPDGLNSEDKSVWNRIENRFKYAYKVNELNPKFGRLGPVLQELGDLAKKSLNPGVNRHFAYVLWLTGRKQEACDACTRVPSRASPGAHLTRRP